MRVSVRLGPHENWLFAGHPEAGQRSTILYSIIVLFLRHCVEPIACLRDALSRLPDMKNQDDFDALVPSRWPPRSQASTCSSL